MIIPIGFKATAAATEEVGFRCDKCNHHQRAKVLGIGTGVQSFLNSRGTARRRAHADVHADVVRTIRFATCPSCHRRSGYLPFLAPYAFAAALFITLGIVMGYAPTWFDAQMRPTDKEQIARWVVLVFTTAVAVVTLFVVRSRWSANDKRVRWLDPSSS